jgi:hypothetical protein
MATASDLITQALDKVSVYSPTTAQTTTALNSLNSFVRILAAEELGYAVTGETHTLTAGTAEYTWGSGGDIDSVRPMRLDNCFLRDSNNYDYPVDIIAAKDYNDVISKTLEARPDEVYFLPEYSLAKIIFNYEPDAAYTAYLDSWKPITVFASASATMSLPPEFEELLIYNLAVRCGEDWDRTVKDTVYKRAKDTMDTIKLVNATVRKPPRAKFDLMVSRGRYNINTDI